jgi:predicted unusual protein kinase regulating ubiquinone biosynthesis (AarF/ABC1/UbiB family)
MYSMLSQVEIEGDFANIAVGLMLIEGLGQQLDPEMDLLKASVPFLKEAVKRRLDGEVSKNEMVMTNIFKSWWKRILHLD